ncbi:MAG: hypothetical protein K8R08_07405, partial [Methanosarcinales archaeon]|nr:hypothetical protein [Methanosarcinales archaeon]
YYWNGDYSDLDKCFNYFGISKMTQIRDGPGRGRLGRFSLLQFRKRFLPVRFSRAKKGLKFH